MFQFVNVPIAGVQLTCLCCLGRPILPQFFDRGIGTLRTPRTVKTPPLTNEGDNESTQTVAELKIQRSQFVIWAGALCLVNGLTSADR